MKNGAAALPVVLLLCLNLAGCGTIPTASKIQRAATAGKYAAGLALMEKNKQQYSGPNNMLYYYDRGTLLQRVGDFKTSTQELNQAELLIDELHGTSVSEAAISLLTNDMSLSYTGEDFEQVMIHVIKELNFLYENKLQGAMVEARKVNTRLVQLADKYGGEAIYKQDAFARYLAAFAREADRDYNGAYIDYKKAYQGFRWYEKHFGMPVPPVITWDLIRLSRWLGFDDQHREWRKEFGDDIPDLGRRSQRRSEVLIVVYDGMIPVKDTYYIKVPIRDANKRPYLLKVAFPTFRARSNVVDRLRVGLADGQVVESQLMEPLAAIAYQTLKQRIGLISVKAIARATTKYLAASAVRQAAKTDDQGVNFLVGLATNVFTAVTEKADTRSWRTLPNRFHVARVVLPPGEHELELRIITRRGTTRSLPPLTVKLKKGQKKVVPVYVPR